MPLPIRTVYHSNQHLTLVLSEDGHNSVYRLDAPGDVHSLFLRLGFPERGHVTSGVQLGEAPLGPVLTLHRTYVQNLPGASAPERLIWCTRVLPDRETDAPRVLTPAEALREYGIKG